MASTKKLVTDAIRARFDPARAEEIIDSDAFGALVYRVKEHDNPPAEVLGKLSDDDVEFAAEDAENPAAFLAAKIRDL